MGAKYNRLGEECKSRNKEKGRKFVWVGDHNYAFTFFQEEQFLHGAFWPAMEF
jgi:hypothetical protein